MTKDIPLNTFASACYEQNTVAELEAAITGAADPADMAAWDLTADQWRAQIELALAAKRADAEV